MKRIDGREPTEAILKRFSEEASELAFTVLSISVATRAIASIVRKISDENLRKEILEAVENVKRKAAGYALKGDFDSLAKEARTLLFASGKSGFVFSEEDIRDMKDEEIVKVIDKARKIDLKEKVNLSR